MVRNIELGKIHPNGDLTDFKQYHSFPFYYAVINGNPFLLAIFLQGLNPAATELEDALQIARANQSIKLPKEEQALNQQCLDLIMARPEFVSWSPLRAAWVGAVYRGGAARRATLAGDRRVKQRRRIK